MALRLSSFMEPVVQHSTSDRLGPQFQSFCRAPRSSSLACLAAAPETRKPTCNLLLRQSASTEHKRCRMGREINAQELFILYIRTAFDSDSAKCSILKELCHPLKRAPLDTLMRIDILNEPLMHQNDLRFPTDLRMY